MICLALTLAWLLLLIRVIVSWIEYFGAATAARPGRCDRPTICLIDVTELVLRPLRRIVPPAGMFDLSVLVAFVIIFVAQQALC